jgi:hypothetical protein
VYSEEAVPQVERHHRSDDDQRMKYYSLVTNYICVGVGDGGAYLQLGYSDDTIDVAT